MEKIRIGIVGVGGIANGAHIPPLQACADCQITAVCDIDQERLDKAGDKLGLDAAHRFHDYHDLIACADVDAVEVCTPNYLHVPIALEVVKAGKKLNCEKPLALSGAEAESLEKALEAKQEKAMMCFSYRFKPAVRYAKKLMEDGALGKVLGVSVEYLKDSGLWPGRKLEWRFVKEYAGTGVLGDLGVHLIDLARFLIGDFKAVCGRLGVIVPEREKLDGSGMGKVETDDFCSFLAVMEGDVNATFNITRCAYGHHNTIKFVVYGDKGTISFNLDNPEVLGVGCKELFPDQPQLHEVPVPEGFNASQEETFVHFAQGKKEPYFPSVKDGVACQRVLDALELSSKEHRWVEL